MNCTHNLVPDPRSGIRFCSKCQLDERKVEPKPQTFTETQLQNGFAAVEGQSVERCAAILDRIADEVAGSYGKVDPDTGSLEFRNQSVEDRYNELRELADEVRAIKRVYTATA